MMLVRQSQLVEIARKQLPIGVKCDFGVVWQCDMLNAAMCVWTAKSTTYSTYPKCIPLCVSVCVCLNESI